MKIREIVDEIQLIWNHKEAEEQLVYERSNRHKFAIDLLRGTSVYSLIVASVLYFFLEGMETAAFDIIVMASILLYVPVWISGWLYQDHIGGSLRAIGLWALFSQVPYTLLYDSISISPAVNLFVFVLIARFGMQYIPLALLGSWTFVLFRPIAFIACLFIPETYWLLVLIPLLFWPVICTWHIKKTRPKQAVTVMKQRKKKIVAWPQIYLLLLVAALFYIHL